MADVDHVMLRRLLFGAMIIASVSIQPDRLLANDRRKLPVAFRTVVLPANGSGQSLASPPPEIQNVGNSVPVYARITVVRPADAVTMQLEHGTRIGEAPAGSQVLGPVVTIGGSGAGAQVTFSRMADFVGRPIDIFRPIGPAPVFPLTSLGMPSRMPVAASYITSGFGYRVHPILGGVRLHAGVDLAAPYGTPVFATTNGRVGAANWYGGYGLFVAVDQGSLETRYGHMSRLNVVPGQNVRQGDLIGYVGSTGRSTGPHLHYEIRVNGMAVNPVQARQRQARK